MEVRTFLAGILLLVASWCSAEELRPLNEKLITFARGRIEGCATFSPDGRVIATAAITRESVALPWGGRGRKHWSQIRLWDAATGDLITTSDKVPGVFQDLRFLVDSRTLAAVRSRDRDLDGTVDGIIFWSLKDDGRRGAGLRKPVIQRESAILSSQPFQRLGWRAVVTSLAMSPDGEALAASESYSHSDNTSAIRVWKKNGESYEFVSRKAEDFYVGSGSLCFSPDGHLLISHVQQPRDRRALVTGRDVSDLNRIVFRHAIAQDSERTIDCKGLAPVPHSSKILFGALNKVGVFDIEASKELEQIDVGFDNPVRQIVVSHDGRFAAVSSMTSRGTVALLDLASRRVVATENAIARKLDFSPDDRLLLISGSGISLWDVSKYTDDAPRSRVRPR